MSELISLDPTVEDLMEALLACDRKTQHFIQPMLGIPAVQHTLLVFLRDGQKTLQEWIWDPRAHSHLSRLREIAETQPAENCAGLSQQFDEALGAATVSRTLGSDAVVKVAEQGGAGSAQNGAENGNGAHAEDVEQDIEMLVVTAEAANQRAKALFKSKDYRGALAAGAGRLRRARARARATAATCLCNAAVAAAKAGRASDAADAATRALRMSDGRQQRSTPHQRRPGRRVDHAAHTPNGIVLIAVRLPPAHTRTACPRVRARPSQEEQDMYEPALRDVEAALALDKGVPDVRALHTRLALRVQRTQDLQLADAIWAEKQQRTANRAAPRAATQAEAEAEEEARLLREREAWEPPKPPTLVRPEGDKKTASMLLNEYTVRNKFAVDMQVEELIGDGLFRVSMILPGGCGVRVSATERSQKGARQTAAAALLRGAAERWNLKHPEDPIDMALMELPAAAADGAAAPGQAPPSTKELVPPTEEFAQWASSWLALLTDNSAEGRARRVLPGGALHRLLFPACLDSQQRLYVHKQCDGRLSGKFNLGIASKSVGTEVRVRTGAAFGMHSRSQDVYRTHQLKAPAPLCSREHEQAPAALQALISQCLLQLQCGLPCLVKRFTSALLELCILRHNPSPFSGGATVRQSAAFLVPVYPSPLRRIADADVRCNARCTPRAQKKGRKVMVSRTSAPRRTLLEVAVPAPMAPPDAVDLAAVAVPIPPDELVQ
ncbi:hypothetical protein JKP88DRAFT_246811 [Tribonema minus]|uniref:DRBM domain-containing protein n=1 Tax=Tribonema minus TaxID=303371 RepID=A0A835YTM9_9STRA|nr:hypothetical protein JKP88DRAFT_246811 [Tribonema minus]